MYDKKQKTFKVVNPNRKEETVADVQKFPFKAFPERGISKETCERFGVRAGLSEKDGKTIEAFYFPSFNQKGKIVGYKKQDITVDKSHDYHWTTVGSVSIGNKLFGQNTVEEMNRKRINLICTEGEWDALSVYEACVDSVKGTKFEGMEPTVVSIPMGTKNAVEAILHNEAYVKSYTSTTIFFDDDHCTPAEAKKGIMKGHEAREAVAGALVDAKIPLFTISPGYEFKDASDYLQAGKSKELAKLVQFERRPYSAEKIIKAGDISLEELLAPQKAGVMVECFPKLMNALGGLRESELSLVLAPSNAGKTTVCSIIGSAILEQNKLGMIYLEEDKRETFLRLLASRLQVNFLKFKENPESVVSKEKIEEAYKEIVDGGKLAILDHFGSLPVNDLMNKVKQLHLVEGCNFIILDHISMVVSGIESDNERKDLDMAMTALASFCAAYPLHCIVVSHINRTNAGGFLPPKGKEGEPFWVNVTKESARGSSALEGCSWNIIAIEPEIMPDFSRGRVRLKVLKTRFGRHLGITDVFKLDQETWQPVLENDSSY